jgi:hypothetical protein
MDGGFHKFAGTIMCHVRTQSFFPSQTKLIWSADKQDLVKIKRYILKGSFLPDLDGRRQVAMSLKWQHAAYEKAHNFITHTEEVPLPKYVCWAPHHLWNDWYMH